MMAGVERADIGAATVEVIVAHDERATLRVGDVFVKIDAEGSEAAIWQGMTRTVSANPGITIVLEFKPASYPDAAEFLSRIRAAGFPVRAIEPDGTLCVLADRDALAGGDSGDVMLFLRRE